jgi:aldehyde:ferredoxin oxidoreductase
MASPGEERTGETKMATPGYTGKILRVNLTTKQISSIDTSKYEAFGGGYGIATAIFWDLCVAPGGWDLQDPFDSRNIVSLMTSPLTGSSVPFGGRTSVSGLAPQSWPISWFSRSNFGGSFAIMLKLAGWDGVVIEGKSDVPVYINIVDDKVTVEDAKSLWGLSTWETQEEIWRMQSANVPVRYGAEWQKLASGYTTLRPAIVTIGPAGENKSRVGSLVHGAGSGAGQGGFGGVLGSKNLKAVAVMGTGSVKVADPKAVWAAREWYAAKWPLSGQGSRLSTGVSACMGCNKACRTRNTAFGNESNCMDTVWYNIQSPPFKRTAPVDRLKGGDIIQKYGLNAFDTCFGGPMYFETPGHPIQPSVPASTGAGWYFRRMYDLGVIGPGKKFDTHPLVMDQYETIEFAESYANAISKRIGIGDLLAEGVARFSEKIGRISDMNDILRCPAWGYVDHWTMPNVEWAYGTLTDSRDINNHDMQMGPNKQFTCEDYVKMVATETPPNNDPFAFDYSWQGDQAYKTGVYSDHKARFVAWRQHYAMFYKESVLYCDWAFANYYNAAAPGGKGATPEAEPVFFNAVTGKNLKFEDGIEIGRRIWNLKRAIFALQGRHRDMEKFAGFMYRPGASAAALGGNLPVYDGSSWSWKKLTDLYLDEKGVEQWKTAFYTVEGWDSKTGYPTRKTLEGLGLKHVADVLEAREKLGAA